MPNKLLLFEKNCLENNIQDNFATVAMLQNYLIECFGNKEEVKSMIKQVLLILNYSYSEQDINDEEIISKLPLSFISKFKTKMTEEEQQIYLTKWNKSRNSWWRRLLYDKNEIKKTKKELEKNGYINYELSNWLYLIKERTWFFNKFSDNTENSFIATFCVTDDFLANPFKLLFIHSGAKAVKPLDKNMNVLENDDFDVW